MSDETVNRERGNDAFAHLAPLVNQELRRLEQRYLQRERTRNTGQPSALVTGALANRTAGRSALTGGGCGQSFHRPEAFLYGVCSANEAVVLFRAKGP